MEVAARFFPKIDNFENNSKIKVDDGSTVQVIVDYVIDQCDLEEFFDKSKDPRFIYRVMLNGRDVKNLNGYETDLKEGDMISFLLPVAGG